MRKVLEEKLRSRAQNGEKTLWNFEIGIFLHLWRSVLVRLAAKTLTRAKQKQFRQLVSGYTWVPDMWLCTYSYFISPYQTSPNSRVATCKKGVFTLVPSEYRKYQVWTSPYSSPSWYVTYSLLLQEGRLDSARLSGNLDDHLTVSCNVHMLLTVSKAGQPTTESFWTLQIWLKCVPYAWAACLVNLELP